MRPEWHVSQEQQQEVPALNMSVVLSWDNCKKDEGTLMDNEK